jgi:glycerol-3-phosphate acyltransferase PlsY
LTWSTLVPSPLALGFWLAAYLIGSISFAELVARRAGVDIRAEGSKNPGATNVGRVLGKRHGRIVLVLDVVKALVPTLAASFLLEETEAALTGFLAAFGHCYPIWHRFAGGKGVASAAGALLALAPIAGVLAALTFLLVRKRTQRASVGSLAGAAMGALFSLVLWQAHFAGWPVFAMATAILVLVVWRHRENIERLRAGTEPPS